MSESDNRDSDMPYVTPAYYDRTPRDLMHWDYEAVKSLIGRSPFCLYFNIADHHAVFFHELGEFWLFTQGVRGGISQVAPEMIEDWIGSSALKEPKADPAVLHVEELPQWATSMLEAVRNGEEKHVWAGEILAGFESAGGESA